MPTLRVPTATALILIASLFGAAPAPATFPGRNGAIVVVEVGGTPRYGQAIVTTSLLDPRRPFGRGVYACDERGSPGCVYYGARVSPDGRRFAFGRWVNGPCPPCGSSDLLTIGPGGPASVPLPALPTSLAWEPGGTRMAVTLGGGGQRGEIRRIGLDGRDLGRLATGDWPDWAADGTLAFVTAGGGATLRPGGRLRLIARGASRLSWSPGSRWLAFEWDGAIYRVRSDGSRLRLVTARGTDPAWSPDGRRIAFVRSSGVYTIRPEGRGLRRVARIDSCFDCAFAIADWQALPR